MRVKWNRQLDGSLARRQAEGDASREDKECKQKDKECKRKESPKLFRLFRRHRKHKTPELAQGVHDANLEADEDDCASISSIATIASQPTAEVCQRDRTLSIFSSFRLSFPGGKKKSKRMVTSASDNFHQEAEPGRYSTPDLRKERLDAPCGQLSTSSPSVKHAANGKDELVKHSSTNCVSKVDQEKLVGALSKSSASVENSSNGFKGNPFCHPKQLSTLKMTRDNMRDLQPELSKSSPSIKTRLSGFGAKGDPFDCTKQCIEQRMKDNSCKLALANGSEAPPIAEQPTTSFKNGIISVVAEPKRCSDQNKSNSAIKDNTICDLRSSEQLFGENPNLSNELKLDRCTQRNTRCAKSVSFYPNSLRPQDVTGVCADVFPTVNGTVEEDPERKSSAHSSEPSFRSESTRSDSADVLGTSPDAGCFVASELRAVPNVKICDKRNGANMKKCDFSCDETSNVLNQDVVLPAESVECFEEKSDNSFVKVQDFGFVSNKCEYLNGDVCGSDFRSVGMECSYESTVGSRHESAYSGSVHMHNGVGRIPTESLPLHADDSAFLVIASCVTNEISFDEKLECNERPVEAECELNDTFQMTNLRVTSDGFHESLSSNTGVRISEPSLGANLNEGLVLDLVASTEDNESSSNQNDMSTNIAELDVDIQSRLNSDSTVQAIRTLIPIVQPECCTRNECYLLSSIVEKEENYTSNDERNLSQPPSDASLNISDDSVPLKSYDAADSIKQSHQYSAEPDNKSVLNAIPSDVQPNLLGKHTSELVNSYPHNDLPTNSLHRGFCAKDVTTSVVQDENSRSNMDLLMDPPFIATVREKNQIVSERCPEVSPATTPTGPSLVTVPDHDLHIDTPEHSDGRGRTLPVINHTAMLANVCAVLCDADGTSSAPICDMCQDSELLTSTGCTFEPCSVDSLNGHLFPRENGPQDLGLDRPEGEVGSWDECGATELLQECVGFLAKNDRVLTLSNELRRDSAETALEESNSSGCVVPRNDLSSRESHSLDINAACSSCKMTSDCSTDNIFSNSEEQVSEDVCRGVKSKIRMFESGSSDFATAAPKSIVPEDEIHQKKSRQKGKASKIPSLKKSIPIKTIHSKTAKDQLQKDKRKSISEIPCRRSSVENPLTNTQLDTNSSKTSVIVNGNLPDLQENYKHPDICQKYSEDFSLNTAKAQSNMNYSSLLSKVHNLVEFQTEYEHPEITCQSSEKSSKPLLDINSSSDLNDVQDNHPDAQRGYEHPEITCQVSSEECAFQTAKDMTLPSLQKVHDNHTDLQTTYEHPEIKCRGSSNEYPPQPTNPQLDMQTSSLHKVHDNHSDLRASYEHPEIICQGYSEEHPAKSLPDANYFSSLHKVQDNHLDLQTNYEHPEITCQRSTDKHPPKPSKRPTNLNFHDKTAVNPPVSDSNTDYNCLTACHEEFSASEETLTHNAALNLDHPKRRHSSIVATEITEIAQKSSFDEDSQSSSSTGLPARRLHTRCSSLPLVIGQVHVPSMKNHIIPDAPQGSSRIPRKHATRGRVASTHLSTSKQPVRPPMWLSKAELTQEIQRLGTLCEARTKELNRLKMETKHVTVGFDAFAALFKYMVEDVNGLSVPKLSEDLNKTLKQLELAKQDLAYYEREVEEMKAHHCQELNDLSNKLFEVFQGEVTELGAKHQEEINSMKLEHEQQLKATSETYEAGYEESRACHEAAVKKMQQELNIQREELQLFHEKELQDLEEKHSLNTQTLQEHIEQLQKKCAELKLHSMDMEDAMRKDTDTKLQWVTSKKGDLEKEVESLKAVLEMKNKELHTLRVQNLEMQKQLEELPLAREKIKMLSARAEDLEALMIEKTRLERKLSSENQVIKDTYEKESKVNMRLSMENEELQWRLRQAEQSFVSASFSEVPESTEETENETLSPVRSPPQLSRSVFFTFIDKDNTSSPRSQYKKITPGFSSGYKTSPSKSCKSPSVPSPLRNRGLSDSSVSTPKKGVKATSSLKQKRQRASTTVENGGAQSSFASSMVSSVGSECSVFDQREGLLEEHQEQIMETLEILREQRCSEENDGESTLNDNWQEGASKNPLEANQQEQNGDLPKGEAIMDVSRSQNETGLPEQCTDSLPRNGEKTLPVSEPPSDATTPSDKSEEVTKNGAYDMDEMSRSAEFSDPKTYYHMTFNVMKESGDGDVVDRNKTASHSSTNAQATHSMVEACVEVVSPTTQMSKALSAEVVMLEDATALVEMQQNALVQSCHSATGVSDCNREKNRWRTM